MSRTITLIIALTVVSTSTHAQDCLVSIADDHIRIHGDLQGLAGIEAQSPTGRLSLDFVDVPGVGRVDLKLPFPGTATVVDNSPTSVVIGVLGAENRIDIAGNTPTSIGYDGDNALAKSDLTVNVGGVACSVVPEPASGWMAAIGLVGLLHLRRRS